MLFRSQKEKENLNIDEAEAEQTAKTVALAAVKYGDLSNPKKNQTKTTVVFKSVKPGVYYLAGRAYVKGYAKSYTKWSKIKKIVVK